MVAWISPTSAPVRSQVLLQISLLSSYKIEGVLSTSWEVVASFCSIEATCARMREVDRLLQARGAALGDSIGFAGRMVGFGNWQTRRMRNRSEL